MFKHSEVRHLNFAIVTVVMGTCKLVLSVNSNFSMILCY